MTHKLVNLTSDVTETLGSHWNSVPLVPSLDLTGHKHETIPSYLDQEGKKIILLGDANCDFAKKAAILTDQMT